MHAYIIKVVHIHPLNIPISQYVHVRKLSWQHDDGISSHLALYSILPYPEAIAKGVISIVQGREEVLNDKKKEATVSPLFTYARTHVYTVHTAKAPLK